MLRMCIDTNNGENVLHGLIVLNDRWMSEWEFDLMYFVLHARCSILTQQFNVLKKLIYNNVFIN